jgi:hypothetical protein
VIGNRPLTARSGREALEQLARDQTVEILVADVNMPGLSGVKWQSERVVFGLDFVFSCCPAATATAAVFPFSKSRSPNPICGALWKRQSAFAIEALVTAARGEKCELARLTVPPATNTFSLQARQVTGS